MYGEEDVDPEGGAAVMSDKVTYSFDDMLSQVQVYNHGLLSEFARAFLIELVCVSVNFSGVCLSVCHGVCLCFPERVRTCPYQSERWQNVSRTGRGIIDAETCEN